MGLELLLTHGGPKSHVDIASRQPGVLKNTQAAQSLATGPWPASAGSGSSGWEVGVHSDHGFCPHKAGSKEKALAGKHVMCVCGTVTRVMILPGPGASLTSPDLRWPL